MLKLTALPPLQPDVNFSNVTPVASMTILKGINGLKTQPVESLNGRKVAPILTGNLVNRNAYNLGFWVLGFRNAKHPKERAALSVPLTGVYGFEIHKSAKGSG